jgi:hypothetical protein
VWQTHYDLCLLRTRELEAEADRRRLWQQPEGRSTGRRSAPNRAPSGVRAGAARAARLIRRAANQFAVRLDGRACVEQGPDRSLRDA